MTGIVRAQIIIEDDVAEPYVPVELVRGSDPAKFVPDPFRHYAVGVLVEPQMLVTPDGAKSPGAILCEVNKGGWRTGRQVPLPLPDRLPLSVHEGQMSGVRLLGFDVDWDAPQGSLAEWLDPEWSKWTVHALCPRN